MGMGVDHEPIVDRKVRHGKKTQDHSQDRGQDKIAQSHLTMSFQGCFHTFPPIGSPLSSARPLMPTTHLGRWASPRGKGIQKSFLCVLYFSNITGTRVQSSKIPKERNRPREVPKNCLNTAPVYPKRAEMSNFKRIRVRDRSMGFPMEPIRAKVSKG